MCCLTRHEKSLQHNPALKKFLVSVHRVTANEKLHGFAALKKDLLYQNR